MLTITQILEPLVDTVLPLVLFLTAAIWLAGFAERAGIADRLAKRVWRAARGRPARVYGLTCLLCAALTATVSLDGAVVLMVPVLRVLGQGAPDLRRPLLLGTIGVANAFSLALPQGNPANLILIQQLHVPPTQFVAHLFAPALLATVLAAAAVAFVERRALRSVEREPPAGIAASPSMGAKRPGAIVLAVVALVAAALGGAVGPWLGVAPWWTLCGVAALTLGASRLARFDTPPAEVPWRISLQVAALAIAVTALPRFIHAPASGLSPALLVALALAAAGVAAIANNLPATLAFASLLGAAPLPAYAALTGLAVGALATPRGSVATLIAFERAGQTPDGYLRLWLPTAAAATIAATLLLATTA